jgi:hypothetical protein
MIAGKIYQIYFPFHIYKPILNNTKEKEISLKHIRGYGLFE